MSNVHFLHIAILIKFTRCKYVHKVFTNHLSSNPNPNTTGKVSYEDGEQN